MRKQFIRAHELVPGNVIYLYEGGGNYSLHFVYGVKHEKSWIVASTLSCSKLLHVSLTFHQNVYVMERRDSQVS